MLEIGFMLSCMISLYALTMDIDMGFDSDAARSALSSTVSCLVPYHTIADCVARTGMSPGQLKSCFKLLMSLHMYQLA